jgi:hypothetical protein
LSCSGYCTGEVKFRTASVNGVNVHIVSIDMNKKNIKVTPLLANTYPGGCESFSGMIGRAKPTAAINGTFFSTTTFKPVGDIVIDGTLRHFGGFGTAMAITPDNRVRFIKAVWGRKMDWSGYETVIACGPRLLTGGKITLNPQGEGFRDPRIMGAATRSAIGVTDENILFFACIPGGVTLNQLAEIMRNLGCIDAMNLDGGASTALYYRGKYIIPAGRQLTNIIQVFENFGERMATEPPKIDSDSTAIHNAGMESADKLYQKGVQDAAAGETGKARKAALQAVKQNPTAANYRLLARIEEELGNYREAADAYAEVARIYYEIGDYNAAVVNADKALALHPEHEKADEYYNKAQEKRRQK